MANRKLARTLTEGGRTSEWKLKVREEHRRRRRSTREKLLACRDVESAEEYSDHQQAPAARYYTDKFRDRFGALTSWLESKVGRPYAETYSELRSQLDLRKVSDWHLWFHAAGMVQPNGATPVYGYYVDDDGLLQEVPRWHSRAVEDKKVVSDDFVQQWVGQRRIIQQGSKFFWAVLVNKDIVLRNVTVEDILTPVTVSDDYAARYPSTYRKIEGQWYMRDYIRHVTYKEAGRLAYRQGRQLWRSELSIASLLTRKQLRSVTYSGPNVDSRGIKRYY